MPCFKCVAQSYQRYDNDLFFGIAYIAIEIKTAGSNTTRQKRQIS